MKKFTNVNILDEKKRKRKNIIISLLPIVLAFICWIMLESLAKGTKIEAFLFLTWIILLVIGLVFLITAIVDFVSYPRGYRKLDESKIQELDNEMNNQNTSYYKEMKFYLTDNYIIDLINDLEFINYNDILWMYRFEHKTNNEKVNEGIRIVTGDAKYHDVANLPANVITDRTREEIYSEIWQKLAGKNGKMLLGYTEENIGIMTKKMEEITKNNEIKDEII